MTQLTKSLLNQLAAFSAEPCLTFIVPTVPDNPKEYDSGRIHCKNLVAEAEEKLAEQNVDVTEIEILLEPIKALDNNSDFWAYQGYTLVIFSAPNFFEQVQLPHKVNSAELIIDNRFAIRPLLPYFSNHEQFYLLRISQNEVALYEGDKHTISSVTVDGMATSIDEALAYDDPEKRTFSRSQGGTTLYHGHHPKDEDDSNLRRFVSAVEKAVYKKIGDTGIPLLLAGVETYEPIYKAVNQHSHLVDGIVSGSFDEASPNELHEQAWPIMYDYFEQSRTAAWQRYEGGIATKLTTDDGEKIIAGAHYGQIDTLFLPVDSHLFGTFDAATGVVTYGDSAENTADLLDNAAAKVLLQGGTIYAASKLAAILRSPVAI